jgi:hypothetical protein
MRKHSWKFLIVAVCAAMVACNSGKAPAEAAIKLAEEAVNGARAEAEKLVPDDAKSLSDDLAALKDMFAKGDYKGALAAAGSLQQKANQVLATAKAKKDELTNSWNQLSEGLPKMIDAIKSRVDILSQSKRLPKGMDAATLASAKDGLAAATSTWNEAQEAFKSGNLTDALAKANSVKDKATAILGMLGMQAGGGAAPAPAK